MIAVALALAAYPSELAAVQAFVAKARAEKRQQIEYCGYVTRRGGAYELADFRVGSPSGCPGGVVPEGTVASVHTHPIHPASDPSDLSESAQTLSLGDVIHAEALRVREYMAGPAGHVIEYVPGSARCRGERIVLVQLNYRVAVAAAGAKGRLPAPDEWLVLNPPDGRRVEPPAFCRAGGARL